MDARTIIQEVERLSREKRDEEFWLPWINAALDDLTPAAHIVAVAETALTSGIYEYALPTDCHRVVSVAYILAGLQTVLSHRPWQDGSLPGFKLRAGYIRLQGLTIAGGSSLEIVYYQKMAHLENVSETPVLGVEWHELIVLFVASRVGVREEFAELRAACQTEYFARRQVLDAVTLREADPTANVSQTTQVQGRTQ